MAQTMRAAIADAPDMRLRLESIPVPTPRRGEVLVKVSACGACHTDLHVMKGEYKFPYPCVLGHEVAGVVVDLGETVEDFRPGDRVVASFVMPCGRCRPCARGQDNLCERFFTLNRGRGHLYDDTSRLTRSTGQELAMFSAAGLAEYVVVPETALFHVPESVALESAAVIGCSVLTAYGAARHSANLLAGQTVAVVATGGVGLAVVQVAKAFGASQIIAIDISADKLDAAQRLGATHVVNALETDPVSAVRDMTRARGVAVAFEVRGVPDRSAGPVVVVLVGPCSQAANRADSEL